MQAPVFLCDTVTPPVPSFERSRVGRPFCIPIKFYCQYIPASNAIVYVTIFASELSFIDHLPFPSKTDSKHGSAGGRLKSRLRKANMSPSVKDAPPALQIYLKSKPNFLSSLLKIQSHAVFAIYDTDKKKNKHSFLCP
jgi:hypothetical protein